MKLVVDANVLIAALIKSGATRDIFLSGNIEMHSPDYLKEEIEEHRAELIEKADVDKETFNRVLWLLLSKIIFVPADKLLEFEEKSKEVSPDAKDRAYFALALCMGEEAVIWSNDKKLKEQGKVKVYSTSELLEIINIKKM